MENDAVVKRRGRPPKAAPTNENTVPFKHKTTTTTTTTEYHYWVLRDKLSGQYVDWNCRLNPIMSARMWASIEDANEFRNMGYCPEAEEAVSITLMVEEAV